MSSQSSSFSIRSWARTLFSCHSFLPHEKEEIESCTKKQAMNERKKHYKTIQDPVTTTCPGENQFDVHDMIMRSP